MLNCCELNNTHPQRKNEANATNVTSETIKTIGQIEPNVPNVLEIENKKIREDFEKAQLENEKLKKENERLQLENYGLITGKNDLISYYNKVIEELNTQVVKLKSILQQKESELSLTKTQLNISKTSLSKMADQNTVLKKKNENLEILLKNEKTNCETYSLAVENEKKKIFENNKKDKEQLIKKINELEEENKKLKYEKMPILVGLQNIGATCYMNATIQCLSNTKKLTDYFLNNYQKENNRNGRIISEAYYNVVKNLWNRENKIYAPYEFKKILGEQNSLFAGAIPNDSKDLINYIIETLHTELDKSNINDKKLVKQYNLDDQLNERLMADNFIKEFKLRYNSIISNLFFGSVEIVIKCLGCNNFKFNFQIYSFIEFPLEKIFNFYSKIYGYNNGTPRVNLIDCFEFNRKEEFMNGSNQMHCHICKKLCDSLYAQYIYTLPNILIINLNRGKGAVFKCDVDFPEKLNLLGFIKCNNSTSSCYQLYAVICHHGPSSMSGHFVAYCKHKTDNNWYLYNDASVTKCKQKFPYKNGMPYILFYEML